MKKILNNKIKILRLGTLGLLIVTASLFLNDYFNQTNLRDKSKNITKREIIDNFALYDHEGKFQELNYYSDQKAIAIISHGNGCPIIRKSIPYLNQLKQTYEPYGIVFLMVNANSQDDRISIAEEAAAFNISIPILEDKAQIVLKPLDITRTAEVMLIDTKDWSIIYRGAISDGLGYESERAKIRHHYLQDAIEAFLNNKPILISKTKVKGCLINFDNTGKTPQYTYTKDVAPILKKNCVVCHFKGGIAPWSMNNYQKIKGWGPMIREVVRTKRMPPWHADPYYGEFKNDVSLSTEETKILLGWIEQNYVRGEDDDLLARMNQITLSSWRLGEPDLKFKLKSLQEIPATGADEFRFIEADRLVGKNIWIKAIDIIPGNAKVIHHGNLAVEWPTESESQKEFSTNVVENKDIEKWYQIAGLNMEKGSLIAGYAPGNGPFELPENTGIFVPKGSKLIFRIHYITTGRQETDLTEVGIYLHNEIPPKILSVSTINNRKIRIGAGEKNYRRSGEFTFKNDVVLTALQPHMHYRGKSMKFIIEYPDGSSEIALSVPNYRFHWQRRYEFVEPKKIPKGTKIHLEGYYDNSSRNPDNPDPQQEVVFGPYSHTEMFQGILFYIKQ